MNEQSSKKILFNKSTLFSLKAELLRKQEEVNEKKQQAKHKLENFKLPLAAKVKEKKTINNYKKTFKDSLKAVDTEELEACRKAKLALEKKAELYEHLSDKTGDSQLAGRFLVDFDSKKKLEVPKGEIDEQSQVIECIPEQESGDDNEWTEFTDCLGRTRKCHKSDLDMFLKRDRELMKVMNKSNSNDEQVSEVSVAPAKEKPLLVQKTNDYLQSLREKWEQKEQELLAKDKDIHYQDLLFDEARIHGVGYYAFSTDDTERKKQMDELIKQREETLKAQQETELIRKKRDEMMAARVTAARARQRARAGLPPEEPKEASQKDFTTCLLEFLTQQKNEADAKATEEERKAKEEAEKERQKLREAYVREWDIGKEGVEEKPRKFKEMSQEEYVELQRNKRINEFAPLHASVNDNSNVFDKHGKMLKYDGTSVPRARTPPPPMIGDLTWADVRPNTTTAPTPDIVDLSEVSQKGLYFSSSKKKDDTSMPRARTPLPPGIGDLNWADMRPNNTTALTSDKSDLSEVSQKGLFFSSSKKKDNVKYKNFVKAQELTPIVNEVNEIDISIEDREESLDSISRGTEVAPPLTYDYYGPVPKKARYKKPFESDIREAFDQGAKSLETKSSNRKLPQHYDFTFD